MLKRIRTPRLWMCLAVAGLACVFLFPIWQITLEAAQFPGGLRLFIWINKFSGDDGTDRVLQNINILNHYIGMQSIKPDTIPELRYFPYVIMGMMALGVVATILNKSWCYGGWLIILIVLGILGFYDFYLWMYNYGHNLDPKAAIKVPGMSFMPPLFGEKDLLNFYVKSYPHFGTMFFSLSILFSFLAVLFKRKQQHERK